MPLFHMTPVQFIAGEVSRLHKGFRYFPTICTFETVPVVDNTSRVMVKPRIIGVCQPVVPDSNASCALVNKVDFFFHGVLQGFYR
jgi:hypothetical protein